MKNRGLSSEIDEFLKDEDVSRYHDLMNDVCREINELEEEVGEITGERDDLKEENDRLESRETLEESDNSQLIDEVAKRFSKNYSNGSAALMDIEKLEHFFEIIDRYTLQEIETALPIKLNKVAI